MPLLDDILAWLAVPENLIEKVVLPLALLVLVWLTQRGLSVSALVGRSLLAWTRRVRTPHEQQLQCYRACLDKQTFQIHHGWMKEGQTLADILVPVVVESEGHNGGIDDWVQVLARYFSAPGSGPLRLAVVGGPGSGKSVALKVAAREAWLLTTRAAGPRVPVLLTFGNYRAHKFELLPAVCASLRARGFAPVALDKGDPIEAFAKQALADGRLLLLLDALDELELDDRRRAADRLVEELGRYDRTAAIFSCRTAAWHGQFSELRHETIAMAGFTPAAIRRFVRGWSFAPPKSSDELLHAITEQPHIAELVQSPLVLTIIAFLYSQPKYHLPENRATFYEYCSHALLEEWDQHRNPERANRFERHHKKHVLARLAHVHLASATPDADFDEHDALSTIAEVMAAKGLKSSENNELLQEICEKSGLLTRLPPSGLRFPHQTFLEFFAALEIRTSEGQDEQLLARYVEDPQRWREVLLLYIGLGSKPQQVSAVIERVEQLALPGAAELELAALADARAVEPELAARILDRAGERLRSELQMPGDLASLRASIVLLGHVASNARMAHSERAAELLRESLGWAAQRKPPVDAQTLEALLLASLRRPTEATSSFVIEHIDDLRLGHLLPLMGERAFVLSAKIMGDPELSPAKKREWIDGLERGGGERSLIEILASTAPTSAVHDACAAALARKSGTDEFRAALADESRSWDFPRSEEVERRWGWPFAEPQRPAARRLMLYLAECMAARDDVAEMFDDAKWRQADRRLVYLAGALRKPEARDRPAREATDPDETARKLLKGMVASSQRTLRSIWRKASSRRWCAWIDSELLNILARKSLLAGPVVAGWVVLACISWAVGESLLGLRLPGCVVLFAAIGASVFQQWFEERRLRGVDLAYAVVCPGGFIGPMIRQLRAGVGILLLLAVNGLIAASASGEPMTFWIFWLAVSLHTLVGVVAYSDTATAPLCPNRQTKALLRSLLQ
jgi:hypothetical protein